MMKIVCLRQMSPSNETIGRWPTTRCTLSTSIQDSTWKKTSVCDRCYYIQPLVCLLLRLRGTIIPVSSSGTRSWKWTDHRAFWKATSAATYSAKHKLSTNDASERCLRLVLFTAVCIWSSGCHAIRFIHDGCRYSWGMIGLVMKEICNLNHDIVGFDVQIHVRYYV